MSSVLSRSTPSPLIPRKIEQGWSGRVSLRTLSKTPLPSPLFPSVGLTEPRRALLAVRKPRRSVPSAPPGTEYLKGVAHQWGFSTTAPRDPVVPSQGWVPGSRHLLRRYDWIPRDRLHGFRLYSSPRPLRVSTSFPGPSKPIGATPDYESPGSRLGSWIFEWFLV